MPPGSASEMMAFLLRHRHHWHDDDKISLNAKYMRKIAARMPTGTVRGSQASSVKRSERRFMTWNDVFKN